MVEVIAKNTFISLTITSGQEEFADFPIYAQANPRARSADTVRSRQIAEVHEQVNQQSTQRLNAVLSVCISSGAWLQSDLESKEPSSRVGAIVLLSELRDLQQKLGKALGKTPIPSEEGLQTSDCKLKQLRNVSNCSLSTMAPEDASEVGSLRGGLSRMRNVLSSGSVSTMASDWADCVSESGEDADFQLNIEEEPNTHQALPVWPDTESEDETQLEIPPIAHSKPQRLVTANAVACKETSHMTPEFSHSTVPRYRNWAALRTETEKAAPPTTLMIRNIPSRLSQQDLVMELQELGFAGTFDFLYIPIDKNTLSNVGYAFVNFVEPRWAKKCMETFQNYRFNRWRRGPSRVASVSIAHLQGLEKNLQHYENSAVNVSKQTQRRPLVMTSIGKIVE
jgi:hypothetical protein